MGLIFHEPFRLVEAAEESKIIAHHDHVSNQFGVNLCTSASGISKAFFTPRDLET